MSMRNDVHIFEGPGGAGALVRVSRIPSSDGPHAERRFNHPQSGPVVSLRSGFSGGWYKPLPFSPEPWWATLPPVEEQPVASKTAKPKNAAWAISVKPDFLFFETLLIIFCDSLLKKRYAGFDIFLRALSQ
jgi:hypothetical protein